MPGRALGRTFVVRNVVVVREAQLNQIFIENSINFVVYQEGAHVGSSWHAVCRKYWIGDDYRPYLCIYSQAGSLSTKCQSLVLYPKVS